MTNSELEDRVDDLEKKLDEAVAQIKKLSMDQPKLPFLLHQAQFPNGIIKQLMLSATSSIANGDLYYGDGDNNFTRLAIGTAGQVLTVSGGIPVWS